MTTKTTAKSKTTNTKRKPNRKRKNNSNVGLICATVLGVMTVVLGGGYFAGRAVYSGKYLAGTQINNVDVGGKTYDEACEIFNSDRSDEALAVKTIDGKVFNFDGASFDYVSNSKDELKKIFDEQNHAAWFTGFSGGSSYTFDLVETYDKAKLEKLLDDTNWGETETVDAKISYDDEKCQVVAEVQGNTVTDKDKLNSYVESEIDKGNFNISLDENSGCYTVPAVKAADLEKRAENINNLYDMSITYDFDYTTETLKGKTLVSMLSVKDDGTYTVKEDKVEEYVEKLGKKYDTYNTERKFHSTLQGDIIIPTSSDARYGWWIYQDETVAQLEDMLEAGESVDSVKPVYYADGGYEYTGVESARTKDDDIGNTYIEIDLSAQYLWYYKDGKLQYETNIVSGQTTSLARTTLPGVYKVWLKDKDHRMKDTNSDGESWDTTCYYWNQIAIVGIGLHDTVSRTAFGGNIYTYLGSHGCINMPLEASKYVYNNVDYGTPVVMYYKSADSDANSPFGL